MYNNSQYNVKITRKIGLFRPIREDQLGLLVRLRHPKNPRDFTVLNKASLSISLVNQLVGRNLRIKISFTSRFVRTSLVVQTNQLVIGTQSQRPKKPRDWISSPLECRNKPPRLQCSTISRISLMIVINQLLMTMRISSFTLRMTKKH